MIELELAWAAGFFDGDGCVTVTHQVKQGKPYSWLSMSAAQSDRRPLERLASILGGRIIPVGPNALSVKQRWRWQLTGRAAIITAMESLAPYLSDPTLEQWDRCLAACPGRRRTAA